jgi:hypothetical protein
LLQRPWLCGLNDVLCAEAGTWRKKIKFTEGAPEFLGAEIGIGIGR